KILSPPGLFGNLGRAGSASNCCSEKLDGWKTHRDGEEGKPLLCFPGSRYRLRGANKRMSLGRALSATFSLPAIARIRLISVPGCLRSSGQGNRLKSAALLRIDSIAG